MSPLRDDALATLASWAAPTRQRRLRQEYLDHLAARPDGLSRTSHPAHVTAGALVLSADASRVLLTLHAKAGRWFHLGGHCEAGDTTLAGAALREASEESGIQALALDPVPLQLNAHDVAFCAPHGQVRHLDVRFLAVAPAGAATTISDESLDLRWWPVHDLPTEDVDLLELVDLARARVGASGVVGARR